MLLSKIIKFSSEFSLYSIQRKGIIILIILFTQSLLIAQPFITTWKTDNPGFSNNTSIKIVVGPGYTYNYDVDWDNDGTFDDLGVTGDITHDYGTAGTYTIAIQGDFHHLDLGLWTVTDYDSEKLISIDQWGSIVWKNMKRAFLGTSNMNLNASDSPDLTQVTSMYGMFSGASLMNADLSAWNTSTITNMNSIFYNASSFNGNITNWDVSQVTNMTAMFTNAISFNQNISGWTTSNVVNMSDLFRGAILFNQDLNSWNVDNVTTMFRTFMGAKKFNQDLNSWNTTNVVNMADMFRAAHKFNGNISTWNTFNVTTMENMFWAANDFNQDIGGWTTSNVTNMFQMFKVANSFNQNIGGWNTSSVTNMASMFENANLFNHNIGGWNTALVTNMNYMFAKAFVFNQDISTWNTSLVTDMSAMFWKASLFNQNIENWQMNSVIDASAMFQEAISYDFKLGNWDISNMTNMVQMLDNSGLSKASYDNTIIGWESQGFSNRTLGALNLIYCNSESERLSLINTYNWTFIGDTKDCASSSSGYVGINTSTPLQTLHVNGAIMIGETQTSTDGTIRFQNQKFEGYDGATWNELGKENLDNDPNNEIELPASATTNQVLTWNGTEWVAQNSASGADDWGSQVVNTNGSNISGDGTSGNPIVVTDGDNDSTNEYNTSLSLTGNILSIVDDGGTLTKDLKSIVPEKIAKTNNSIEFGANKVLIKANGQTNLTVKQNLISASVRTKIGDNPTIINNTAILELESTNKVMILPRMTNAQMITILTPPNGSMVFNTTKQNFYQRANGVWNNMSAGTTMLGAVISGVSMTDSKGWYILNGRPLTNLPAIAQSNAATLGLIGNLPNAGGRMLKGKSSGIPLLTKGGQDSVTLVRANLPDITLSGSAAKSGIHDHAGTTDVNGTHDHSVKKIITVTRGSGGINTAAIAPLGENTSTGGTHVHTFFTDDGGEHSHSVIVQTDGMDKAFSITSRYLTVNMFIYLGE